MIFIYLFSKGFAALCMTTEGVHIYYIRIRLTGSESLWDKKKKVIVKKKLFLRNNEDQPTELCYTIQFGIVGSIMYMYIYIHMSVFELTTERRKTFFFFW